MRLWFRVEIFRAKMQCASLMSLLDRHDLDAVYADCAILVHHVLLDSQQ